MSEERKEFLRLQIRELKHQIWCLERDLSATRKQLLLANNELFELSYPVSIWWDEFVQPMEGRNAETV